MQLCVMQTSFSNLFLPLLLPPLPAVDSFTFSTCDSLGRGARHSLHWPYRLDGVPNHELCCFIILALQKATTRGLKRQPTQATKILRIRCCKSVQHLKKKRVCALDTGQNLLHFFF